MTAAKIMDIISRLPGFDGQAADAVSAYTQVKMEDGLKLLKVPKSECPDIWIRLPRHKWPKSWSSMEDPVVLNKKVDLGEPTSFLDHVYLGCTQRQCEVSKDIVDNCRTMFESRISAGRLEKLPFPQNIRISSWSYDMAGHAKKCVERYCELANKTTLQSIHSMYR